MAGELFQGGFELPSRSLTARPLKVMVGRLSSPFWDGLAPMLNFQGVRVSISAGSLMKLLAISTSLDLIPPYV